MRRLNEIVACIQASAAKYEYMRTALFWVIKQSAVVISYERFGTTCRSHHQGSRIQKDGTDRL
jgi:hypothetical protein